MTINNTSKILLTAFLLFVGNAFATPSINVVNNSGAPGDIITVVVNYDSDGLDQNFQFDLTYDAAVFATPATAVNATAMNTVGGTYTANEAHPGPLGANTVRFLTVNFTGAIDAGIQQVATIDLTVLAGAAPGATNITISGLTFTPSGSTGVGNTGAVITINGPDWSPAGGSTINMSAGSPTNATGSLTVTNAGVAGTTLTGTCVLSGGTDAEITITGGAAISLASGASSDVVLACDGAAVANYTGTLECTHNGDGSTAATPLVTYPINCDILAITPQYTSILAAGTAFDMGTGAAALINGISANSTDSIDIDNTGDALTNLMGTCTTVAPFSVTGGTGAFNVAENAATDHTVTFECDANFAPGIYSEDLSCTHNGSNVVSPVTYPLTCDTRAPVSGSGTPSPVSGTSLNVTVPPGGTGVNQVILSENGGELVAITDLVCSVTGPEWSIISPIFAPNATIPAAGSLPVVVQYTDTGVLVSDTLVCDWSDSSGPQSGTWPLAPAILAVQVPVMNWLGYAVMILGLGLLGFWGFRRSA